MTGGRATNKPLEGSFLRSGSFRALISASLLIMTGFGLLIPALPLIVKDFGRGEAAIGLVITAFALTRLGGSIVTGALIDRFGERALVSTGVVIVGVSSIAAAAAQNYPAFVALRAAGGVGSALFLGALMAYLVGAVPDDQRGRAMSVFQAAVGIGLLIGPVIGGVLIHYTTPAVPLYAYGAVCIVSLPLVWRAISRRIPAQALERAPAIGDAVPAPRGPAWGRIRPLLRNRTYRAAIAVSGLGFFVTGALWTLVPSIWTERLDQTKATSGIPFAVMATAALVVVWHAGALSDRKGRRFAVIPAVAVTALASLAIGFAGSSFVMIAAMGALGLASGYMRPGPTAMVADVSSLPERGVAVGGYRIAQDVGSLVGPITAGWLAETAGFASGLVLCAAMAGVVFVMMLLAEETAPAVRRARA